MSKFVTIELEDGKRTMININHIVHLAFGSIKLSTGELYRIEDESWYELLACLEFYEKEHGDEC